MEVGMKLFQRMKSERVVSDAVVFNVLLDGVAHASRVDLVDGILQEMESMNIRPSNHTVSILVKLYGRVDLDKAFHAVTYYPKKYNFSANTQVRTCLISTCLANHRLDKAFEVYHTMTGDCRPDRKTHDTLMKGTS